jgi:TPR repeat protein
MRIHVPMVLIAFCFAVPGLATPAFASLPERSSPANDTRSLSELRAAADQGDAIAQFTLGVRYAVGHDTDKIGRRSYLKIG